MKSDDYTNAHRPNHPDEYGLEITLHVHDLFVARTQIQKQLPLVSQNVSPLWLRQSTQQLGIVKMHQKIMKT